MGTSGLAPCFASTQLFFSCDTSTVLSCYSSSPCEPSWQPLWILHLELMPSFTCKWEPGMEQWILHWRAVLLQPHNWPLHQKQATSNQRSPFRPTHCRNERGKTLGKVFQCLFPVPAACQRVNPWFTTTAGCWLLICTIPRHSVPWTDPTYSSDSHTYRSSAREHWHQWDAATHILPQQLPLPQRLSWFNKLKFMDPWLGLSRMPAR